MFVLTVARHEARDRACDPGHLLPPPRCSIAVDDVNRMHG
jgi:hypothetical protein